MKINLSQFESLMLKKTNKMRFRGMKSGFTLMELLLVIIITVIMASIAMNGIIKSQAIFRFNAVYQSVTSLVREARSYAVTGKAQIDYTDYDNDGCRAGTLNEVYLHGGSCTLNADTPDYVTPANYGITFVSNKIILFADLHDSGIEGQYDGTPAEFYKFEAGKDMKLAEYEMPPGYVFYMSGGTDTVFYSPIFADISFNNVVADFFVFGVEETAPGTRKRCSAIHRVSGAPESADKIPSLTCGT